MVALIAAAALAVAGASADEAAKLADARDRWSAQHARDYVFRLRVTCFCVLRDPVQIRVRDRKPRGTPYGLRDFETVPELFARIQEEIDRGGRGLNARYGARGVPKDFAADPIPDAVDDEYAVTVRRMRITRRSG